MVKLRPKPHQVRPIQFASERNYSLLALDMGLGKTPVSLWASEKAGVSRLLVICPASLIPNWSDEVSRFLPEKIADVFSSAKQLYRPFDTDVAIISYNLIQKAPWLFDWADGAIIDEAHELANMGTNRTIFIHKNVYESSLPWLTLLTGTPIKNRVMEYYSLISLCHYDPKYPEKGDDFLSRFPDAVSFADYFSFREEYTFKLKTGRKQRVRITRWDGFRRPKKLKKLLKPFYLRMKESEGLGLPPYLEKFVLVSEVEDKKLLAEFEAFYSNKENKGTGATHKKIAALKTAPFTAAYVKKLLEQDPGNPILVFSDHPDALREICSKIDGAVVVDGKVSSAKRGEISRRFQAGEIPLLGATYRTMATGFTLTRGYQQVLNDFPWVPGSESQAIARMHRMTQKRRVVVHRIFGSPQARKIWATLEDKRKTIERVV